MGTLLGPGHRIGGTDPDPCADGDIAPLLRWALREQVSGQEPADAVWQGVQGRVSARRSQRVQLAGRLTTAVSAMVVALILLTVGMTYSVDEEQPQLVAATVQPAGVVEAEGADPALPLVVASSIVRVLPLPHPDIEAPATSTSAAIVERPRAAQLVDPQDDALRPIHRLRVTLVSPVSVQPVYIVSVMLRGESPKPM